MYPAGRITCGVVSILISLKTSVWISLPAKLEISLYSGATTRFATLCAGVDQDGVRLILINTGTGILVDL